MIIQTPASRAEFASDKMAKSDLLAGEHLFCGLNSFEPGQTHAAHTHRDQDKLYVVLDGSGEVTIGGETQTFNSGDVALAPAGVEHALHNPGPGRLVVLAVISPPPRPR